MFLNTISVCIFPVLVFPVWILVYYNTSILDKELDLRKRHKYTAMSQIQNINVDDHTDTMVLQNEKELRIQKDEHEGKEFIIISYFWFIIVLTINFIGITNLGIEGKRAGFRYTLFVRSYIIFTQVMALSALVITGFQLICFTILHKILKNTT